MIQHALWLYARFTLSFRDVEEMLAERGIDVSNETVRRWFPKVGRLIAGSLRRSRPKPTAAVNVSQTCNNTYQCWGHNRQCMSNACQIQLGDSYLVYERPTQLTAGFRRFRFFTDELRTDFSSAQNPEGWKNFLF